MDQRKKNFTSSFKVLVEHAEKKNVKVLYENTWETFEDFIFIASSVPGMEINVDIAHAFLMGGMPSVRKFLSLDVQHIHMSDNMGKKDDHLQLGEGKINFIDVVKHLKKIQYDKTITFETFVSPRRSPEKAKNYIKELLVKA
jgi:sugar phosphate isomerase/epimerase